MAEELDDLRATELWQVLDWTLWGNGLGDELRTPMADAMISTLSAEQREQAEACIKAWHERRGPSVVVAYGPELERQRDEAEASRRAWAEEAMRLTLQQEAARCTGAHDCHADVHYDGCWHSADCPPVCSVHPDGVSVPEVTP